MSLSNRLAVAGLSFGLACGPTEGQSQAPDVNGGVSIVNEAEVRERYQLREQLFSCLDGLSKKTGHGEPVCIEDDDGERFECIDPFNPLYRSDPYHRGVRVFGESSGFLKWSSPLEKRDNMGLVGLLHACNMRLGSDEL